MVRSFPMAILIAQMTTKSDFFSQRHRLLAAFFVYTEYDEAGEMCLDGDAALRKLGGEEETKGYISAFRSNEGRGTTTTGITRQNFTRSVSPLPPAQIACVRSRDMTPFCPQLHRRLVLVTICTASPIPPFMGFMRCTHSALTFRLGRRRD